MKKPTIAELQRRLGETESTLGTVRANLRAAEARLSAEIKRREDLEIEASSRENGFRDDLLRMTRQNARLRGYIDRIEDEAPRPPQSRYSAERELEALNHRDGSRDPFARMGLGHVSRRAWHHR